VTDATTPTADVREFVGRGVAAQNGVDAAIAGACVGLVRRFLLDALAELERGDRPAAAANARQSLLELGALEARLLEHFERLGIRKGPPP
jgi:hypothetical protein